MCSFWAFSAVKVDHSYTGHVYSNCNSCCWVKLSVSLRTCYKSDTRVLILMKLKGVMYQAALTFFKLLCLAQGGNDNYLANILITSHISHTAGGLKPNKFCPQG